MNSDPQTPTPISLLGMDPRSSNLPQLSADKLHFPREGAEIIAELEQVHFWHRTRIGLVKACLKKEFGAAAGIPDAKSRPTGLDIGCGSGWIATELTANGFLTVGIDGFANFSKPAIAAGTRLFSGDIFAFAPQPEFDFILLLDVLEHIDNDAGFLVQAMRFLKPGGIAVIHVPAFQWLCSPVDTYMGHVRRYTKPTLRKTVAAAGAVNGASLEKIHYCYALTLPLFMLSRWMNRLRRHETDFKETEYSPPRLLNDFLMALLTAERVCLPPFPFGSSLLAVVRK